MLLNYYQLISLGMEFDSCNTALDYHGYLQGIPYTLRPPSLSFLYLGHISSLPGQNPCVRIPPYNACAALLQCVAQSMIAH